MSSDIRRRLWHTLIIGSSFSGLSYLLTFNKSFLSRITGWCHWCPTTPDLLEQAELKLFSYIKKPINLQFLKVDSPDDSKEECRIRTLIMNHELANSSTPLVLLHGFASGIGLWILNLETLSENRPVYALDLLGFGRSSRPPFSKDPETAEHQFVESIEEWRKQANLEHFILLGHSMGGYLAAAYAIKYPHRVKHLILADPWGFPDSDLSDKKIILPVWVKFIATLLRPFNPLAGLRAAGPWGPQLVQRFRPDILGKFETFVEDTADISNYIYHCNSQIPSGEAAFKSMTAQFGWAKRPMLKRISQLSPEISATFIYGSRSWIDSTSGVEATRLLPNSFIEIKLIQGAGHHVYADKASEFNILVCETCDKFDEGAYSDIFKKKHISEIPHNHGYKEEDIETDTIPA